MGRFTAPADGPARPEPGPSLADWAADPLFSHTPWAAYTLGLESQMVRLWAALPGYSVVATPDLYDGVAVSVDRLRVACDCLLTVGPAAAVARFGGVLAEIRDAYQAASRRYHRLGVREPLAAPALALLPAVADQVAPGEADDRRWYDFGRAAGGFVAAEMRPHGGGPPSFAAVVEAARRLPAADLAALRGLRGEADPARGWSPLPAFCAVLATAPGGGSEAELQNAFMGRRAGEYVTWATSGLFGPAVLRLTQRLHDYLLTKPAAAASRQEPEPRVVPDWRKGTGELWFGGEVVRRYSGQARRVMEALDEFQRLGWPDQIEMPAGWNTISVDKESNVASMNNGLRRMRFTNGRYGLIGWERRPAG